MHKLTKQVLRERILTLLRKQKEEDRLAKSRVIQDRLFKLPEFKKSEIVLFYAPFDGEVDTLEMIKLAQKIGKKIGLPKIIKGEKEIVPTQVKSLESELETGPYGIKQPKDNGAKMIALESLDLVIVPGVAFDKKNNRLGRGGGYYDRFLKILPARIPSIGLAFDFQMVDCLPQQEAHDVAVTCVLAH